MIIFAPNNVLCDIYWIRLLFLVCVILLFSPHMINDNVNAAVVNYDILKIIHVVSCLKIVTNLWHLSICFLFYILLIIRQQNDCSLFLRDWELKVFQWRLITARAWSYIWNVVASLKAGLSKQLSCQALQSCRESMHFTRHNQNKITWEHGYFASKEVYLHHRNYNG